MKRLSTGSLDQLNAGIELPTYDRSTLGVGIIHLGPGAFHRAHQAAYLDALAERHIKGWGICGVSLRSNAIRNKLTPQDCLYTLAIRDAQSSCKIIGSLLDVKAVEQERNDILNKFEDPGLHIVSMTITEKGYCLTPTGDLDVSNPGIQRDLVNRNQPVSAIGYLVEGLARRRAHNLAPFTSLSCDNLVGNGERLAKAVHQFAGEVDRDLARWIEDTASFPNTMVDSITPATSDELLAYVNTSIGVKDAAPIQREAFTQWVIEDNFCDGRPPLEEVGVTFTKNVAPYEQAKLRILNGLHSTLAFIGFLRGHKTVAEAMADEVILRFLRHLTETEILGSLELANLGEYVDSILKRFQNPAIEYQLLQIAGDSSQKIQFRLMGTVRDNLKAGLPVDGLAISIASWLHYVRQQTAVAADLNDPKEAEIKYCAKACSGDAWHDLDQFACLSDIFAPDLLAFERFRRALADAYKAIEEGRLVEVLTRR